MYSRHGRVGLKSEGRNPGLRQPRVPHLPDPYSLLWFVIDRERCDFKQGEPREAPGLVFRGNGFRDLRGREYAETGRMV